MDVGAYRSLGTSEKHLIVTAGGTSAMGRSRPSANRLNQGPQFSFAHPKAAGLLPTRSRRFLIALSRRLISVGFPTLLDLQSFRFGVERFAPYVRVDDGGERWFLASGHPVLARWGFTSD